MPDISLSLDMISGNSMRTVSMSSSVLKRPSDIRTEDLACSGFKPMAVRTWEASSESSLQAEPVETNIFFVAKDRRIASASKP